MTEFRRELPAEGLARVEIKLWRGNLTVQSVGVGDTGFLECDGEIDVNLERDVLRCKQNWGLASLLGEQQVRIAIDGNVLLDKQIAVGGRNLRIVLPASVRELHCDAGQGSIRLDGVDANLSYQSGSGSVVASNGRGRVLVRSGACDVKISAWRGSVETTSGKGDLVVQDMYGDVQAKTGKGNVMVNGANRVSAQTGYGDLTIGHVTGEANLQTGRGHILGTDLDGTCLDARTGQGDIILGGHLAGLKAETRHGDIVCRCSFDNGSYELKSKKGDLSFDFPTDIGARIDAFARHGRIESDLPLITVGTSGPEGYFGKRVVGSIGEATSKTSIVLRADYGDIKLFRSKTGDSIRTERHVDQPGDPERLILEALSRGELAVEEALALLEGSSREL